MGSHIPSATPWAQRWGETRGTKIAITRARKVKTRGLRTRRARPWRISREKTMHWSTSTLNSSRAFCVVFSTVQSAAVRPGACRA